MIVLNVEKKLIFFVIFFDVIFIKYFVMTSVSFCALSTQLALKTRVRAADDSPQPTCIRLAE